ncbi:helix-turn-helix transcriptional regulator [Aliiroseovarius subalbicans]|uniref:helix-turn-helix transcriptional regulator n=1 Tax=Aliiroseovarius subalbicans TaxID=2925840 RepID=UPI001F58238A|nr:helix-turn-helix transcriptional regulator [Aliiroseovarius subalbicans]MCI2399001.1 short-chain fatty acyl-CoA regulator family protein [Aliiroseovarius subalbicans]
MPQSRLTGSRIRERRLVSGIRQADLARSVGISPAYLNLIEHNRRRIGGKLLVDLARELGAEPVTLAEGAEAALLGAMRDAAGRFPDQEAEVDRTEDFAGRFSGWARLVAAQHTRIEELERLVEALSDRLTHDPHLAASLHDVLSTVTAIRSAASILTDTTDIDPDWQARFLRNVGEDSARLTDSAQGLVDYLEAGTNVEATPISPQEEVAVFHEALGFHIPSLEDGSGEPQDLVAASDGLQSTAARDLAARVLERYRADARAMPADDFAAAWNELGDPGLVAARFQVDPAAVLRRVAALPDGPATGLVTCDGSGALSVRKPVDGFAVPRFGAGCPLWPVYQALARPAQPIRTLVEMPGRTPRRFTCLAISQAHLSGGFGAPPVFEATMLILPEDASTGGEALPVGGSCRVCPRADCAARREPSILSGSG